MQNYRKSETLIEAHAGCVCVGALASQMHKSTFATDLQPAGDTTTGPGPHKNGLIERDFLSRFSQNNASPWSGRRPATGVRVSLSVRQWAKWDRIIGQHVT